MKTVVADSRGMAWAIMLVLWPGAVLGFSCQGSIPGGNARFHSKLGLDCGLSGLVRRVHG